MGKKVLFLDSVLKEDGAYSNQYGVDDINAIVSNLTGVGIAPFPSGDTYDVSELNTLTQALVAEGTSLDGLKVSFADNKIHIAQGIGYFENGATIVVDSDGEELDYNVAETLYVYAEYNQALNTCGFYTSESEPVSSTGIYVLLLATIAANGTVTDKRKFAQSKVATLGRNITRDLFYYSESSETSFSGGTVLFEEKIDISKYNYLVTTWTYGHGDSTWSRIPTESLLEGESVALTSAGCNVYAEYTAGSLKLYLVKRTSNYLACYRTSIIFLC